MHRLVDFLRTQPFCILVPLLAAVALVASGQSVADTTDDAGDGSSNDVPEWAQKVYGEPPEFKVFEVAGHTFRVPTEYLTASSDQERGVFQIAPHWPTLDSPRTDNPQPRDREDFDTLVVTVEPWREQRAVQRFSELRKDIQRMRQIRARNPDDVERTYGLLREKDTSFFYASNEVIIGEVSQPIRFICAQGTCGVVFWPLANIRVRVNFDRAILPEWRDLIHRITKLLMEYREV